MSHDVVGVGVRMHCFARSSTVTAVEPLAATSCFKVTGADTFCLKAAKTKSTETCVKAAEVAWPRFKATRSTRSSRKHLGLFITLPSREL